MRDRALLPEAGQFYKANLHCHTVLSDGRWTKEQVKEEYRKRGYSVVAFTDDNHNSYAPGDPRCDAFGGFTMLKLPRLGYAEVIEALRQGNFYASTGPEIHRLEIRGGALEGVNIGAEVVEPGTQRRGVRSALRQPAEHAGHGLVYPVHTPPP